ncbi:MAG TPA: uroporphyrinogen-III synthase [Terriglobales bacterium]|nr:uroporphyrinogen-III synthase [Terriglobales bacterium]
MPVLPLSGRRIVVTRALEQAGAWLEHLRALGAEAISLPTIAIAPPEDFGPLDQALRQLDSFQGLIFTSANGVRGFFDRAAALGVARHCLGAPGVSKLPPLAAARPAGAWLCAVGPATAAALAEHQWQAELVAADSVAEGVVAALAAVPVTGQRILLPRAAEGREILSEALGRRGATVVTVATHRTVLASGSREQALALFPGKQVDAAVFTSPSTARNLAELLGPDYRTRLRGVALVAIGPITRHALEELGLPAAAVASAASAEALVQALREYWHA